MIIKVAAYLKQKSKPVEADERIQLDIIKKLLKEIEASHVPALGLSAIQIGIPKAAFVMFNSKTKEFDAYMNPKIISRSEEVINFQEGCLSFPKVYIITRRNYSLCVTDDIHGEQTLIGLDAIVFAHEHDHSNGILFFDRQEKMKGKKRPRYLISEMEDR